MFLIVWIRGCDGRPFGPITASGSPPSSGSRRQAEEDRSRGRGAARPDQLAVTTSPRPPWSVANTRPTPDRGPRSGVRPWVGPGRRARWRPAGTSWSAGSRRRRSGRDASGTETSAPLTSLAPMAFAPHLLTAATAIGPSEPGSSIQKSPSRSRWKTLSVETQVSPRRDTQRNRRTEVSTPRRGLVSSTPGSSIPLGIAKPSSSITASPESGSISTTGTQQLGAGPRFPVQATAHGVWPRAAHAIRPMWCRA